MKLLPFLSALAVCSPVVPAFAHAKDGAIIMENTNVDVEPIGRRLIGSPRPTTCKGPTLGRDGILYPNESICGIVNGTMVYYGIRSYPNEPQTGYTLYRTEVWSDNGEHNRWFQGIGTKSGTPPFLKLQGDGNLLFDGQGSACLAKPGKRGPNIHMSIEGPLPNLMSVRDNDNDIVWSLGYKTLSNNSTYIGRTCYPEIGPRYISVLKERQRLTWNEYVVEYDENGSVAARFGLDYTGLLALWRNNELVWRPGPYHIRGDYLHLQQDGHLTLYREAHSTVTLTWKSKCLGTNDTKITISDGDVYEFNGDGSTAWTLSGEGPLEPLCFGACNVL